MKSLIFGVTIGSSVLLVEHLAGEVPARWYAVTLMLAGLADWLYTSTAVSRSGYWTTRGTDSENGAPCWLVKGGPFADTDQTVAEVMTRKDARALIKHYERLMTATARG